MWFLGDWLGFRLGLAEADDAVAVFPLAAFFEDFDAFETLEDVALCAEGAGSTKARMLSHKIGCSLTC